jgi:hypothetical protein
MHQGSSPANRLWPDTVARSASCRRDRPSPVRECRYITFHMTPVIAPLNRVRWARLCQLLALTLAAALAAQNAIADQDDPCAGFSWNVARERALFAAGPQSIAAGRELKSSPLLTPDRLYELQLGEQGEVTMPVAPGRKSVGDAGYEGHARYAGLARLQLPRAGSYRISLDQAAWIDVLADGRMLDSSGFQGRPGCLAPHKIVQFTLPAGPALVLQFSAASAPHLRVTITQAD